MYDDYEIPPYYIHKYAAKRHHIFLYVQGLQRINATNQSGRTQHMHAPRTAAFILWGAVCICICIYRSIQLKYSHPGELS